MSENRQTMLVTGAAGFVGSYLCKRLVAMGHRVIALDITKARALGWRAQHKLVDYRQSIITSKRTGSR